MQEHALALFWLFPRPEAASHVDARQANCLVRYSSELEGAGENDMMIASVNQTLALPDDATSHLAADARSGTWGGAVGGQDAGGPGLPCVWANQQRSRGRLGPVSADLGALSDDAAIDAWLMVTVGGTGHICGTCRMGAPDDPRFVVDPQGRVLGLEPLCGRCLGVPRGAPRANTNLPTIAAAERLTDLIRGLPRDKSAAPIRRSAGCTG